MKWWKPKLSKRYTKLFDEGRLKQRAFLRRYRRKDLGRNKKKVILSEVGR